MILRPAAKSNSAAAEYCEKSQNQLGSAPRVKLRRDIQRRDLRYVRTVHRISFPARPAPARASQTFGAAGERRSLSACRPRLSRDITVPIGRVKIPAISRQVKPSTTASKSTARCSEESSPKAFEISATSASEGPDRDCGSASRPGASSETRIGAALIRRPCA